jgi:hypothetical protein
MVRLWRTLEKKNGAIDQSTMIGIISRSQVTQLDRSSSKSFLDYIFFLTKESATNRSNTKTAIFIPKPVYKLATDTTNHGTYQHSDQNQIKAAICLTMPAGT